MSAELTPVVWLTFNADFLFGFVEFDIGPELPDPFGWCNVISLSPFVLAHAAVKRT